MSRKRAEVEEDVVEMEAVEVDSPDIEEMMTEDSRLPFGTSQQRLDWPRREGYHRYWFNDTPGRLVRALGAGYKHVLDNDGKVVHRPVGTNGPSGGVLNGYLMEIPEAWWKKDLKQAQDKIDETDADIRRGNIQGKVGEDGRYVPEARPIKITRS